MRYTLDGFSDAATGQAYRDWLDDRMGASFAEQQQADANRLAVEDDNDRGVVMDAISGIGHGLLASIDETAETGLNLWELATGADEYTRDVEGARRLFGMDDWKPAGMTGAAASGFAQFVGAYGVGGPVKGVAQAGIKKAVGTATKQAVKEGAQEGAEAGAEAAAKTGVLGTVGDVALREAIGASIAIDPHDERLMTWLVEQPEALQPVEDFLRTGEGDSLARGRLMNFVDGAMGGAAGELAFRALRRAWQARKGGKPEKAVESAENQTLKDRAQAAAVQDTVIGEKGPAPARPPQTPEEQAQRAENAAAAAKATPREPADVPDEPFSAQEFYELPVPVRAAVFRMEKGQAPWQLRSGKVTPATLRRMVVGLDRGKDVDVPGWNAPLSPMERQALPGPLRAIVEEIEAAPAARTPAKPETAPEEPTGAPADVAEQRKTAEALARSELEAEGDLPPGGVEEHELWEDTVAWHLGQLTGTRPKPKVKVDTREAMERDGLSPSHVRSMAMGWGTPADWNAALAGDAATAREWLLDVANPHATAADDVSAWQASVVPLTPARGFKEVAELAHHVVGLAGLNTLPKVNAALRRMRARVDEWVDDSNDAGAQARAREAFAAYRHAAAEVLDDVDMEAMGRISGKEAEDATGGRDAWEAMAKDPYLEPTEPDMVRTSHASERVESVDEARGELPGVVVGDGTRDMRIAAERRQKTYAERSSLFEAIEVDEAYRAGSTANDARINRPIDVFPEDIQGTDDFVVLTSRVAEINQGKRRLGNQEQARASLEGLIEDRTPWRAQHPSPLDQKPQIIDEVAPGVKADWGAMLDTTHALGNVVRELARKAAVKGSNTEMRTAFLRAVKKYAAWTRWMAGDHTAARAILESARKPVNNLDAVSQRLWEHNQIRKEGIDHVQAMASAFNDAKTLGELTDMATRWQKRELSGVSLVAASLSRSVAKPAREIWINSVLSSPATHMRNILGNSIIPFVRIGEQFIATSLEHGVGSATVEMVGSVQALMGAIPEAFRMMRRDWSYSMAQLAKETDRMRALEAEFAENGQTWMHQEMVKMVKQEDLVHMRRSKVGLPRLPLDHPWGAALAKWDARVKKAVNSPVAALQAEDVFFKTLTYRMELHRLANVQAGRKGLKGDAYLDEVASVLREPPEDLRIQSMQQAHVNTFTNDMDVLGTWTLDRLNSVPGARYVVPFFKTPWNIMTFGLSRTPLALVARSQREAWKQGGRARAELLARQTAGMALMLPAIGMVANGRMTGGELANPQFRWTARAMGRREYAVKVGDTWVDYRNIGGPLGLVLGIGAEVGALLHGASSDAELDDAAAVMRTVGGIIASLADETWMGNVAEFAEAMADPDMDPDKWERFASHTARGFVPFSAAADDVRQMLDVAQGGAVRREMASRGGYGGRSEGWMESLGETLVSAIRKAAAPYAWIGEEGKKYPVLDTWGKPLTPYKEGQGPQYMAAGFTSALSPAAHLQEKDDALSQAVLDLKIPIRRPRDTIVVGGAMGQAVVLELDRDQYQYYAERLGQLRYQYGSAVVRRKGWQGANPVVQRGLIDGAFTRAAKRARMELYRKFPALRQRRDAEKMHMRNLARGMA